MNLAIPIMDAIRNRYSCRSYDKRGLDPESVNKMSDFLAANTDAPFRSRVRFTLITAAPGDAEALKGLGTYGFIKNPAAFIIGAMGDSEKNLEDFGYLMEKNILFATSIGLGSCWLGGSFRKSNFSKKIDAQEGEDVPAVASLGCFTPGKSYRDAAIRIAFGSVKRKPWSALFFEDDFSTPLSAERAGAFTPVLEMTRLSPSASNKQPWRIVMQKDMAFHFYLERLDSYGRMLNLIKLADLPRVDMGISMCHFELTADALEQRGGWKIDDPKIAQGDIQREYIASWILE